MSQSFAAPTNPAGRTSSADRKILAQVEKWLETIREIVREQVKGA
jgi:hypothetical protein